MLFPAAGLSPFVSVVACPPRPRLRRHNSTATGIQCRGTGAGGSIGQEMSPEKLIEKYIYVNVGASDPLSRGRVPGMPMLHQIDEHVDPQPVFVAGATGQAGSRVALALLRRGFAVRAGVPEVASAEALLRVLTGYGVVTAAEAGRLATVELQYGDAQKMAKSIDRGSRVVVTVGPGESGPNAAAGVTPDEALSVVEAAALAGAAHVVVVHDVQGSRGDNNGFLAKVAETGVEYTVLTSALVDDDDPEAASHGLVGITTTLPAKVPKSTIAAQVLDVFHCMNVTDKKVSKMAYLLLKLQRAFEQYLNFYQRSDL